MRNPEVQITAEFSASHRMGITARIALLSWMVTIVTLLIFMMVIIPEQKRIYLENLESKALGVSASLQEVNAAAVVSEDYSSVVEHCRQVLNGDRSIGFLIITRNDGFSLINQTGGVTNSASGAVAPQEAKWCMDTLDELWHPAIRKIHGAIDRVPIVGQRFFHYAKPLDYSGVEWGWIHVGLSLEDFDKSVQGVYRRTGLLAVACLLFSLGASATYARRLIHPLHDLNEVVRQVAAGDFHVRADIRTKDEIQDLAQSFNTMTGALLQRDGILESVRIAAQQFLTSSDWRQAIDGVLAKIGQAAAVSRVYLFENHVGQSYEWVAPGSASPIETARTQGLHCQSSGLGAMADRLRRGEIVAALVREFSPVERALLELQGIQSLLLVPIFVEHEFWGFLGLDERDRERQWTDAERDSMRTSAEMLGAAIARDRTQQALLEANNTLEQRVLERTRELQEQMTAKEKAHAELAEAQQRLIEISRRAGMAEVAAGVIHNVGNVLNSVNISASLVAEKVRRSKVASVAKVASLLNEHADNIGSFMTQDEKGRKLPGYLTLLAESIAREQDEVQRELAALRGNIDHIKEIVRIQQNYARVSGVVETVPVKELVEDAFKMHSGAFLRHDVRLERDYAEVPPITTDKHKVLQILVNLLHNAKYACDNSGLANKQVTVRIAKEDEDRVKIEVTDNGIGIPAENLTKIFNHGFTTRKDGHGFGLHSGANAAKELGGTLTAHSGGALQGATFTLELPLQTKI